MSLGAGGCPHHHPLTGFNFLGEMVLSWMVGTFLFCELLGISSTSEFLSVTQTVKYAEPPFYSLRGGVVGTSEVGL